MRKGWKELELGGVITEAGNAATYKTGDWRTRHPIWDKEKCSHCMLCPIHCPDSAIVVKEGKMQSINYDYCKGCGICAEICPKDAIEMKHEADFKQK